MRNKCVSKKKQLSRQKNQINKVGVEITPKQQNQNPISENVNPYVNDISPYLQTCQTPIYQPIKPIEQKQDYVVSAYLKNDIEQQKKKKGESCKQMCPLGHPSINYEYETVKNELRNCFKCNKLNYSVYKCKLCRYQLCEDCSQSQGKNVIHDWRYKYTSIYAGYGFKCHSCKKSFTSVLFCSNCNNQSCYNCVSLTHSAICNKPDFQVRKQHYRCCYCYKKSVNHLHCKSCNAVSCANCTSINEALKFCQHQTKFKDQDDFCMYCGKQNSGHLFCSKCQFCACLKCFQNVFKKQ